VQGRRRVEDSRGRVGLGVSSNRFRFDVDVGDLGALRPSFELVLASTGVEGVDYVLDSVAVFYEVALARPVDVASSSDASKLVSLPAHDAERDVDDDAVREVRDDERARVAREPAGPAFDCCTCV
jgi:hypothetical protein